jgi:hypothetical protein
MSTDALALLDLEGSGRFAVSEGLTAARDLPWNVVAECVENERAFMHHVAPGLSVPAAKIPGIQDAWARHQGLVVGHDLERLLWIVSRFWREIEVDLLQRVGADLGTLWRDRRWRLLLNLIDHLPRASWSQAAMANDEEYATLVSRSILEGPSVRDDEEWSPPLVEMTPEVVVLSTLVDAVNALRTTLIMANSKPGSAPPKIPPYPRPNTLLDKMVASAKRNQRWHAHEKLADRLLPNRNKEAPP